MNAPLNTNESQRLAKLLSYDILDTESEVAYDDITQLVKQICDVPIALISFVDSDRQWFKSVQGLDSRQTCRNVSFCTHAILQAEVMVIPDATADPRFFDNPLVTGEPHIRFYAGAPLITSDGFALGSLCAIDTQPRTFSAAQRESLLSLSRLAVNQLELRQTLQQRQQAEEKLKAQQKEFEQLSNKAPGMLFQLRRTPEGTLSFPYVSNRAADLFGGLQPAEMIADAGTLSRLVRPEFKAEWRQVIATSAETLDDLDCIVPIIDGQGYEKWIGVHATAEQLVDGTILWHGAMTDVTERKKLEAEAAANQRSLQLILDTVPQGIVWKDRNSVFQGCNHRFAEMLNQASPTDIVGKTDYDITPVIEQAQSFRRIDRQVFESGQAHLNDVEQLTTPHQTTWININRLPIRNQQGKVESILMTIEDITPLKRVQQQVADQAAELQQTLQTLRSTQTKVIQAEKMAGLARLVAGVAHEINNPAGFIMGNIDHARNYTAELLELIDTYQTYHPLLPDTALTTIYDKQSEIEIDFLRQDLPNLFDSMKAGTVRIKNIVDSLRTFSRIDEASFKEVDIHQSLDSTLTLLQHRLRGRGTRREIEIVKHYGQLPRLDCYAGQLSQAFMQILSNAIDALDEYQPAAPKITLTTNRIDDGSIEIVIADNGSGIPDALQDRIFDPFFTTKTIGKGTGMGLSISYQVVTDTHGGELMCNSSPGQGSTFTIRLPLRVKFMPRQEVAYVN